MIQKMEPAASQFLAHFQDMSLSPELTKALQEIAKHHLDDLTSNLGSFFTSELTEQVTDQSALRFKASIANSSPTAPAQLREAWQKISVDFHRSRYWGLKPSLTTPPPKALTEEQKIRKELTPYLWTAFQALIVMKFVIFFFGINAGTSTNEFYRYGLWSAIAVSGLSLTYFGIRRHRKENRSENKNA